MNDRSAAAAAIAAETLAAIENRREMTPFSTRVPDFDLPMAYAAAAKLRAVRENRGETLGGRKIGFTNRAVWAQAGVDRPMWGDVYKHALHPIGPDGGTFALEGYLTPLLEPELMLRLSTAPTADMDETALMACVESYAIGFEIVQSLFGSAKFKQADTVAAGSMFVALLIGPPQRIDHAHTEKLIRDLATFTIDLRRDGDTQDRGKGENVLGGPLSSLRYLVGALATNPDHPPLRADDVVSTGILTSRAMPVTAGETWSTAVDGLSLHDISVTFT